MINGVLISIGTKLITRLIDKIFKEEDVFVAKKSGPDRKDKVYKSILKMTIDEGLSFDRLGDYIDGQVALLNRHAFSWDVGADIINKIIRRLYYAELDQPKGYGREKCKRVAERFLSEHPEYTFAQINSFISGQIELFNDHGLFLNKR